LKGRELKKNFIFFLFGERENRRRILVFFFFPERRRIKEEPWSISSSSFFYIFISSLSFEEGLLPISSPFFGEEPPTYIFLLWRRIFPLYPPPPLEGED